MLLLPYINVDDFAADKCARTIQVHIYVCTQHFLFCDETGIYDDALPVLSVPSTLPFRSISLKGFFIIIIPPFFSWHRRRRRQRRRCL